MFLDAQFQTIQSKKATPKLRMAFCIGCYSPLLASLDEHPFGRGRRARDEAGCSTSSRKNLPLQDSRQHMLL